MTDYRHAHATFELRAISQRFAGDLEEGVNACVECCDRHPQAAPALHWENAEGVSGTMTFGALRASAARFAHLLVDLGVKPGDVIAGLLPRTPELLVTILGTWRAGAVYQPLFTAFGPKAITHRLDLSQARVVVTDLTNRPKVETLPQGATVVVVDAGASAETADIDFHRALAGQPDTFEPVLRRGSDGLMMMATSGTTGLPKAVMVPLRALAAFDVYMREAVDLRPDDRFWNIADPGWAYGLYYAVAGPLLLGCATRFLDGPFTAERAYDFIRRTGVTNLAGSPTAFRLMMTAEDAAAGIRGQLRVVSSAGEPLTPAVIEWFARHLDVPIFDHYGQTETGMVVNNHHGLAHPVRPGSAGFAMPGYRVVVLDETGNTAPADTPGDLAVDVAASPLMFFTGYWNHPIEAISGGFYRTGDTVEMDAEGRVTFVGRSDDVITSSGYRIGPFDVESALAEHPDVLDCAVIGVPDPQRTEIVKAFVVLKPGRAASDTLAETLRSLVKTRLSAHAYPREIEFVRDLPKTPSGKIQRFLLRQQSR
ncbi:AMP-binding protein [Brevundimonas intermedia]|uniref:AMP-binding protein n=1 Tax=Brevundimonas intermedia TaxID=74315 RepID=UPI0032096DE8